MAIETEHRLRLGVEIRKQLREFPLDVSFTAAKGCMGILGSSGCGKSMTLKSIAGIVTPAGRFADRVQELHIKVIHILIELIEAGMAEPNPSKE